MRTFAASLAHAKILASQIGTSSPIKISIKKIIPSWSSASWSCMASTKENKRVLNANAESALVLQQRHRRTSSLPLLPPPGAMKPPQKSVHRLLPPLSQRQQNRCRKWQILLKQQWKPQNNKHRKRQWTSRKLSARWRQWAPTRSDCWWEEEIFLAHFRAHGSAFLSMTSRICSNADLQDLFDGNQFPLLDAMMANSSFMHTPIRYHICHHHPLKKRHYTHAICDWY